MIISKVNPLLSASLKIKQIVFFLEIPLINILISGLIKKNENNDVESCILENYGQMQLL